MVFSVKEFWTSKDFECACKYKNVTKESFVTVVVLKLLRKKVRRDRVGHINLVVPLLISGISVLFQIKLVTYLGLPSKKLDMIIYYERYVVIQAGIAKMVKVNQYKD
jgi:DNA-directed RNA polymerase subunit beta'